MNYLIPLFGILLSFNSISQSTVEDSIWFDHDQSFRKIKVWLPASYDTSKTYQTIYCLDASFLFNPLISSVEIYSDQDVAKIPPSIVVGLYFNHRNNDMGIKWENGSINETGIEFMTFIDSALIPHIESKYSVSNYKSIVGHSNSSSFIHFFLWKETPTFQSYLSMSEFEFNNDASNFCNLNIPNNKPVDFTVISGKLDAPYRFKSGLKLEQIIDSCKISNFNFKHIILEDADHLTMVPQGIPLGLEALYSSFAFKQLDTSSLNLQIGDQEVIHFMNHRVKTRSEKYGVIEAYSFDDLNQLYDIYVHRKDSINIHWATEKYVELTNDSSEYFYEAQHFEMMGAYNLAEQSYLKHLEYYFSPGEWSYKRIVWLYMGKLKQPDKAIYWADMAYLKLGNTDFIDLMVKIALKNKLYKKRVKSILKSYHKNASTEEQKDFLNSKQGLIN